jgi:hypothetical protein
MNMNKAAREVAANNALMNARAQALATLLNRLAWPECSPPYFPRGTAPHVIQNTGRTFAVAINYQTAMLTEYTPTTRRTIKRFHFIDLPTDPSVDVPAWIATEFLNWATS